MRYYPTPASVGTTARRVQGQTALRAYAEATAQHSHQVSYADLCLYARPRGLIALSQLMPVFAECLLFYHGYGYSVGEIAQRQQVERHLVRVRLMRARRQFAAIYRRRAQAGEVQPTCS